MDPKEIRVSTTVEIGCDVTKGNVRFAENMIGTLEFLWYVAAILATALGLLEVCTIFALRYSGNEFNASLRIIAPCIVCAVWGITRATVLDVSRVALRRKRREMDNEKESAPEDFCAFVTQKAIG